MVHFGVKNTWGNIPDLPGAYNKLLLSSIIEKDFDHSLGSEEIYEFSNEASGSCPSAADGKTPSNPVISFVEENTEETSGELKSSEQESEIEKSLGQTKTPEHLPVAEGIESLETDKAVQTETGKAIRTETEESTAEDENKVHEVEEHGDHKESTDGTATLNLDQDKSELPLTLVPVKLSESFVQNVDSPVSINEPQESETSEVKSPTSPDILQQTPVNFPEDQAAGSTFEPGESDGLNEVRENFLEKIKEESREEEKFEAKEGMERVSLVQPEASSDSKEGDDTTRSVASEEINSVDQSSSIPSSSEVASALALHENEATANQNEGKHLSNDAGSDMKEQHLSSVSNMLDSDSVLEPEGVKREMKMMETALQGAARKTQATADEIAKLMNEDEQLKSVIEELKVEENKVESIKIDKMATESLLQEETIEKHQAELADYYTNALAALIALVALVAAKKAEALAEACVNNEARIELESRLREAEERESMLVQAREELRQRLRQRELEILLFQYVQYWNFRIAEMCYRASVIRYEQQLAQVPQLTRPLSRQIEALQETNARRAEVWANVERTLNSRVQEAEAEATAAGERERSMKERLSQTLSRIKVLEAQILCLRAEKVQISRSLEKERQGAAENRQEYLAAKEEADTQEGRVRQLEEEIREQRQKHKQELQESLVHRELLQQEIEREKAARADLERSACVNSAPSSDQTPTMKKNYAFENGNLSQKASNAISLGSMEEGCFLQASLDSSDSFSERRNPGEHSLSPSYMRSMTTNAFEAAALRQKEGELASYMSRLASVESVRDSFAEELVKMTEQCEKLRKEAATLPGLRAELDALRKRHSAVLELVGERDEKLEELRADMADLKEVYKEQVNLLVNKIQMMNSSADIA